MTGRSTAPDGAAHRRCRGVPAPDGSDPAGADRPGPATGVRRMELVVSWVLRIGVVVSVALVACGLVLFLVQHPFDARLAHGATYQRLTRPSAHFPHTLAALAAALAAGSGQGVMVLGLVVLLATPVARVAVGVVAFALERDGRMAAATGFVLLVLLTSIFLVAR